MTEALTKERIEILLQKKDVSVEDLVLILTNEMESEEGGLANVRLFNKWRISSFDAADSSKHVLVFENVEIRTKNLSGADLRYCKFINCSFYTCTFDGTFFSGAKFADCHFCACAFTGASFQGAHIENSKFEFVKSEGELCFIETTIKDTVIALDDVCYLDFKHSSFDAVLLSTPSTRYEGGVGFINPYGFDDFGNAPEPGLVFSVDFTGCAIRNSSIVNVKFNRFHALNASIFNVDVANCYVENKLDLRNTTISNVRISPAFFEALNHEVRSYIKPFDKKCKITPVMLDTLGAIRDNFRYIGNSSAASEYYLLHNNARRAFAFYGIFDATGRGNCKSLRTYAGLSVAKGLFNYGESPFMVLFWIISVVLGAGTLSYRYSLSNAPDWIDNLYLSAITFATVGYGDVTPCFLWGRILFGIEGLLGVFFMSIFVVVLTRKLIT